MAVEIKVPTLGESIVDAVIVKWLKQPGESVARSEPIVELETDKVNVEVPAEQAGVIESIARSEGDTVEVGEVIGLIAAGDGAVASAPAPAPAPTPTQEQPAAQPAPSTSAPAPTPSQPQERISVPSPQPAAPSEAELARRAGPAVRRLAEEYAVDLMKVNGSGPGGRVLPEDIVRHAASSGAQQPVQQLVPATPVTQPSTPSPQLSASSPQPATPPPPAPSIEVLGREERVRMSRRRQTIAARLVEAQRTAAMLTTFNEVDMTAVMQLRKERRDAFKERHGVSLGFMSFFTKAVIGGLRAFPQINAEIQGDEIVYKHYYDIGIAVGASEGLVVPVVRDADKKTFAEIEREIGELAGKARENKLTIDELQGGTFTITNGGIFGSLLSTPILNTPQVGILGMHKIEERPVVVNGEIVIRPMMYLALSYDHRIVDGREAVQFLVRLKELLEDPTTMLLEG